MTSVSKPVRRDSEIAAGTLNRHICKVWLNVFLIIDCNCIILKLNLLVVDE